MSKSAIVLLLTSLACFAAAMLAPPQATAVSNTLGAAGGVFSVLFLAAMVVGRRIKFDPLLR